MLHVVAYRSSPKWIPCFWPLFEGFQIVVSDSSFISPQIVNEIVISIHQILS